MGRASFKGGASVTVARILVAGFGNTLRGDDGFGVVAARSLMARQPSYGEVKLIEVGISGISLVQELMDGYDGLIILDAVDGGGAPGTLYCFEPEPQRPHPAEAGQPYECMADIHQIDPSKALVLAGALGVLPRRVLVIGCQPLCCDDLGAELSEPVRRAVQAILDRFDEQVGALRRRLTEGSGCA